MLYHPNTSAKNTGCHCSSYTLTGPGVGIHCGVLTGHHQQAAVIVIIGLSLSGRKIHLLGEILDIHISLKLLVMNKKTRVEGDLNDVRGAHLDETT